MPGRDPPRLAECAHVEGASEKGLRLPKWQCITVQERSVWRAG
jgi:hypothetical protein